jgi:hypothetical protein
VSVHEVGVGGKRVNAAAPPLEVVEAYTVPPWMTSEVAEELFSERERADARSGHSGTPAPESHNRVPNPIK